MTTPGPLTLTPPGTREVIDATKAEAMITEWTSQLTAYRETLASPSSSPSSPLCNKIILSDKSYTSEAATLIATFLTSTDTFQPPIASGIQIAILSDIIAGRMEIEGLEVLKTICDAFRGSRLVEVDLSDNALGSKGVTACETVLCGPPVSGSLEKLSLCNNGLSEFTMDEVAQLLTKGTDSDDDGDSGNKNGNTCIAGNLSKIHFFNNMSGNKGCESFKHILSLCTDKLTDIRFSGTRARAEGSANIASGLSDLASRNCLGNVTRLDLADNSFGEAACYENIAVALKSCGSLEYLDLHDCCLGDEGIVQVCNALMEAKAPLSFLSLSGNDIGAEDGTESTKKIAALLRTDAVAASLEVFHASENEMKSPGIRRIAKALKSQASRVKEIILNENECGTVGAEALLDMVAGGNVPLLEKIGLNSNSFLEDIADRLVTAFGEKLEEMEDNIDDEDYDDELDPDELEEDEDEVVEVDVDVDAKEKAADASLDDLVGAMGNIAV